jgi:hypothetical protein
MHTARLHHLKMGEITKQTKYKKTRARHFRLSRFPDFHFLQAHPLFMALFMHIPVSLSCLSGNKNESLCRNMSESQTVVRSPIIGGRRALWLK